MSLKENISYWEFSLKTEEPVEDEHYIFDEIIINQPFFIKQVERLRELIKKFCNTINMKNNEEVLDEIYRILENTENIQHHEFIAFWKVLGTTFSAYESFTEIKKRERLKDLLIKYCQKRMKVYTDLHASNITIQALYDKGASRRTGTASNRKIIEMLMDFYDNTHEAKSLDEFENNDVSYFRLDTKSGKDIFDDFCEEIQINRPISEKSFNLVIKIQDDIFLVKTKHMKEGGGSQNTKIIELIDYIGYTEESDKIHYLTFIDGIFFNRFGTNNLTGKLKLQKESIEKTLNNNRNNFFVNTAGLKKIFMDLQ